MTTSRLADLLAPIRDDTRSTPPRPAATPPTETRGGRGMVRWEPGSRDRLAPAVPEPRNRFRGFSIRSGERWDSMPEEGLEPRHADHDPA